MRNEQEKPQRAKTIKKVRMMMTTETYIDTNTWETKKHYIDAGVLMIREDWSYALKLKAIPTDMKPSEGWMNSWNWNDNDETS